MYKNHSLPPGYEENRLVLMMQNPNVLYAYWDLSPGQRTALANKGKLLLRLNAKNFGLCRVYEIAPHWDSFYFTNLETGLEYFCDISVYDRDNESYPVIFSNSVYTPEKTTRKNNAVGSPSFWGAGEPTYSKGAWSAVSSEAYYK